MISTLDLIMVVLWPDMCLFWKNILFVLGENMYSVVEWNVLYLSVRLSGL